MVSLYFNTKLGNIRLFAKLIVNGSGGERREVNGER
jgi:hypothetical protein